MPPPHPHKILLLPQSVSINEDVAQNQTLGPSLAPSAHHIYNKMLDTGSNTVDSICWPSSSPTEAMWVSPALPHLIPAQILPRILDPSPTTSPSFTLRTSKMRIRSRSSLKPPSLQSENRVQVSELNSDIRRVAPTLSYSSENRLPCSPDLTSFDFPVSGTRRGASLQQGLLRLFPWRMASSDRTKPSFSSFTHSVHNSHWRHFCLVTCLLFLL